MTLGCPLTLTTPLQGVSWRVGFTAAHLIGSGQLPPFIIAAVDSAGPMRSLNYLPYTPGTGQGGFRCVSACLHACLTAYVCAVRVPVVIWGRGSLKGQLCMHLQQCH